MASEEKSPSFGLWGILGSMAVGVALGILFAPKKGSELREDIDRWSRNARKKSGTLMSSLGAIVPFRVKAAAMFGAAKAGGAEAIREVKERLNINGAHK